MKEEALLLESKLLDEEAGRLAEKAEWVQVLSLLALLLLKYKYWRKGRVGAACLRTSSASLITCFTGTVYLRYWCKSKNTEAELAQLRSMLEDELSVLTEACVKLQVCV